MPHHEQAFSAPSRRFARCPRHAPFTAVVHGCGTAIAGVHACVLSLVLLCALAATAFADVVIATPACQTGELAQLSTNGCTGVSAHDGRLVWSAYDATSDGWA